MSARLSQRFLAFDGALADAGVPPLSPFWRAEVTRYLDRLEAGESSEWWACAGRGGSKSTTGRKLIVFFALFGGWQIPAGERHWGIILSVSKKEAEEGLTQIVSWLKALDVRHRPTGSEIELEGRSTGIRIVSASVGAASGWRAFAVMCDEFAKWRSEGAVMLDADEVRSSAVAMTATHMGTPVLTFSTPWSTSGSFFDAIMGGDLAGRVVSGPTPCWLANPAGITEAESRRKEPNPIRWRREYACEFADEFEGGFFPSEAIDRCTDRGRSPLGQTAGGGSHYIAIDPAFLRDDFGIVVCHVERGRVVVDLVQALRPSRGAALSADAAVAHVVALRRRWPGMQAVWTDQASSQALKAMFAACGVALIVEPWTLQEKLARFALARNLLVDGRVRMPDDPALRRELSNIGIKLTSAGNETISTRTGTDDRASAFVHALHVAHHFEPVAVTAPIERDPSDYARDAARSRGAPDPASLYLRDPPPRPRQVHTVDPSGPGLIRRQEDAATQWDWAPKSWQ